MRAHADGATAREAADLLIDRLDQRIARVSRTRRGDRCGTARVGPHLDDATPQDVEPGAPVPPTSG